MRIQHNIMAMNAYRNYNNNASALGKNLEKLSSGYKINRAGDDAAGLAISEKMRGKIQGLNAAQKNVKDGISLVKTAEGAMQEIQDMLSRMKYLATQSANGTYDDDVDRKALQAEVDQLNSEINRIADSANFNGTKLLDGSLSGAAAATKMDVSYGSTAGTKVAGSKLNFNFTVGTAVDSKDYELSFTYLDEGGSKKTANIKVEGAGKTKGAIASAVKDKLQEIVGSAYSVAVASNNKFPITAKSTGATEFRGVFGESTTDGKTKKGGVTVSTEGKDDSWTIALSGKKASSTDVLSVNGETFEIVKRGGEVKNAGAKAL